MTTRTAWTLSLLLATFFLAKPITSFTPTRIRPHQKHHLQHQSLTILPRRTSRLFSSNKNNQDNDEELTHSSSSHQRQPKNNNDPIENNNDDNNQQKQSQPNPKIPPEDLKEQKKKQIGMATRSLVQNKNKNIDPYDNDNKLNNEGGLFDKLNPFQAGKNLRKSLDSAISAINRASSGSGMMDVDGPTSSRRSVYYLDDRFQESGGALFTQESNPYLSRLAQEDYIPEVLVVGATGEVGRLVVRRLLLEGNCRCRCLVSDLYSRTLNMLGTGVVYCQGDLNNLDSLEYALTDVDKIVVCAGAPKPDEKSLTAAGESKDERSFREKFLGFAKDNLNAEEQDSTGALGRIEAASSTTSSSNNKEEATESDVAWERMESVLKVRAQLAEQVDFVGMQNLVRAYQNVRYADYGTSQAAKRSLFKFRSRADDFNLFDIDDSMDVVPNKAPATTNKDANEPPAFSAKEEPSTSTKSTTTTQNNGYPYETTEYEDLYDEYKYEDEYEKYAESFQLGDDTIEERQDATVKTQVKWIRNEFGQAVFVGKVPSSTDSGVVGGEASIVSSRLRTRDGGPEDGIDLSGGFGGFVCRVCADGGVYEAFVRDASYETNGIEYVCEFSTGSKQPRRGNASRNKFVSVRLPFESFKPVRRRTVVGDTTQETTMPAFQGKDVRYIGFRFRSSRNRSVSRSKKQEGGMTSFYIALSYIKLFRQQPEPEIVYLSDARIPPVVLDAQVKHDIREIVPLESLSSGLTGVQMFESAFKELSSEQMSANRIPEETYYKYRGEEILKNSGLSYAIVRVAGFNESPSSEASTIELKSTNEDIKPISRAEAAQVCVSALLDPNALNKSFYVTKKDGSSSNKRIDETMSTKFQSLSADPIRP